MAIEVHFIFNSEDVTKLAKVGELGWDVTFEDDRTFRMPNHLVGLLMTHGRCHMDAELVDEILPEQTSP